MENLNDLIWTDEGNADGVQPYGTELSIACMSDVCMGVLCGAVINTFSCHVDGAIHTISCK